MTHGTPMASRQLHNWPRKSGLNEDFYAWLSDGDNPEVLAYLGEENTFCEAWFAQHHSLVEEIFHEIKTRIKEDDSSVPVLHNHWWYVSSTRSGQSYAIHTRGTHSDNAHEVLLLDENLESVGHSYFSLSTLEVSHSNSLLAWACDTDGSEKYDIHFRDIASGLDIDHVIRHTASGSLAWSSDDQWLFYVRPDDAMRPFQVWRHQLGTHPDTDVMIFEETDERFFVGVSATRSGKWIVIDSSSKTSSESWLLQSSQPTSVPMCVVGRRDNVEYQIEHWGNQFAIVSNRDGQDFSVYTSPESSPDQWRTLISHTEGQRIIGFDCFESFAVMQRWVHGQQILSLVEHNGESRDIFITDEPHEVELDTNPDWEQDSIRISYQSLTTPQTIAHIDIATLELTTLKQTEVLNVDLADYISERTWATSDDGTLVPVDYVRHRNTPIDGTAPGLLYVYGAYEISLPPWFSVARLSLLDRGFVWALAHPRGGGEMGRQWYEDGKILNKKNTFVDTIACATHLGDTQVCRKSGVVLRGGSAGGLTVGACINMAPTVFAGAIAEVPFVDVTNTMSDPTLPLTVTEWEEWGDPRQEPYGSYIESYSPYDNVTVQQLPSLFVTAGLQDPRVSFHEPAKWVAKIRHLSPATTVLFTCEMESGHGGPSGRYNQWREEAKTLTFAIVSATAMPPT